MAHPKIVLCTKLQDNTCLLLLLPDFSCYKSETEIKFPVLYLQ